MSVGTRSRGFMAAVAVLGVALASSPAAAQTSPEEVRARALFERAQQAVENRDFRAALDNFERVIELIGPFPELLYNAAQAAWEIDDVDRAEDYVYRALESADADFQASPQHEMAFRLAAEVEAVREEERVTRLRREVPVTIANYLKPEDGAIRFSDGDVLTQIQFSCDGGECSYSYLRTDAERDDFGETVGLRVTVRFRPADILMVEASESVNGFDVELPGGAAQATTHELRNGYPFRRPRSGTLDRVHFYTPVPGDGSYTELRSRLVDLMEQLGQLHRN